jgi:putative ABC transport system permease protein
MEVFSQVAASLSRNKLRSFLTMAGIAWGVASIVLIVAMGDGFKEGQHKNTKALGENIVIVFAGRTEKQAGGQRAGRRIRLTHADVLDIRTEGYLASKVAAELENQVNATSPHNSGSFTALGVEPIYSQLRTIPIVEGRFLNDGDQRESRRVCILGENVRKQLFGARAGAVGS